MRTYRPTAQVTACAPMYKTPARKKSGHSQYDTYLRVCADFKVEALDVTEKDGSHRHVRIEPHEGQALGPVVRVHKATTLWLGRIVGLLGLRGAAFI